MIKTDAITEHKTSTSAIEFDDYCPICKRLLSHTMRLRVEFKFNSSIKNFQSLEIN